MLLFHWKSLAHLQETCPVWYILNYKYLLGGGENSQANEIKRQINCLVLMGIYSIQDQSRKVSRSHGHIISLSFSFNFTIIIISFFVSSPRPRRAPPPSIIFLSKTKSVLVLSIFLLSHNCFSKCSPYHHILAEVEYLFQHSSLKLSSGCHLNVNYIIQTQNIY